MFSRVCVVVAVFAVLCFAGNYKDEFQGKVALVTGGTSGIGFQTALEFAQNGAHVIIVGRDNHPTWFNGSSAVERIMADPKVNQTNGTVRFFKADMSNASEVKALFDSIRQEEKDLHYAVNSAGISGPLGELYLVSDFINGEHCPLRNNLYGTIYSLMYETRFFMELNHSGAIVNLASVNGLKATPIGSLYGTSKWGIIGLSRSVADAHASLHPVIRVNAVAPGLTNTSLSWQQMKFMAGGGQQPWEGDYITPDSELWKRGSAAWAQRQVSHKIAEPENMADTILFLCSNQSSYTTGMVIAVDRGSTA